MRTRERRQLSGDEILEELLLTGLRLTAGIARRSFARLCGAEPEALLAPERVAALVEEGLVALDAAGLRATPVGRLKLNAVIAYLAARRAAPAA